MYIVFIDCKTTVISQNVNRQSQRRTNGSTVWFIAQYKKLNAVARSKKFFKKKRKLHRFLISMTANVAFEISDDMNFELITEKQKVQRKTTIKVTHAHSRAEM